SQESDEAPALQEVRPAAGDPVTRAVVGAGELSRDHGRVLRREGSSRRPGPRFSLPEPGAVLGADLPPARLERFSHQQLEWLVGKADRGSPHISQEHSRMAVGAHDAASEAGRAQGSIPRPQLWYQRSGASAVQLDQPDVVERADYPGDEG